MKKRSISWLAVLLALLLLVPGCGDGKSAEPVDQETKAVSEEAQGQTDPCKNGALLKKAIHEKISRSFPGILMWF